MKPDKIHIHTDEIHSIDANELHSRGAFYRRMEFPFQGFITGLDFIEFRSAKRPADWSSQQILIH